MKRLTVFILISVINCLQAVYACGPYYPFGEQVRFTLLKQGLFRTEGFEGFLYSANSFETNDEDIASGSRMNAILWRDQTGSKLDPEVIMDGIYNSEAQFSSTFTNAFLLELQQKGQNAALEYLRFAHKCSKLNSRLQDPWERRPSVTLPVRNEMIREALEKAASAKDNTLSRRYAFLAIRLAHYNNEIVTLNATWKKYFSATPKDLLDYWALYFKAIHETNEVKRNVSLALVFLHAPDKRFAVYQQYNFDIDSEKVLGACNTDEQKSAEWLIRGITNPARALESIRNFYELNPSSPALNILLHRELSKLEDWIFTPYFSEFEPAMTSFSEEEGDAEESVNSVRIAADRSYARNFLEFIEIMKTEGTADPQVWKMASAYLSYMAGEYEQSLALIGQLQGEQPQETLAAQLQIIKALNLVSRQTAGQAIVPDEIKQILLDEASLHNNRFMFAIARELEYKGNTTDAALILSHINEETDDGSYAEGIYWRSKQGYRTLYTDVYYDYFFYLDAAYTVDQMNALIESIRRNQNTTDFDAWEYRTASYDISRLYDLLGTKYVRKNQLKEALTTFEKCDPEMWTSPNYQYATYLDANPFYTNMYNEHGTVEQDSVRYTKPELISTLISYLEKAENPKAKNRDYYYFLVANCYLNMSYYGNSWMMRRYFASSVENFTGLEDDEEYYKCLQAEHYYLKAREVSKSTQFQALCLRMAGRCEKYRILREFEYGETYYSEEEMAAEAFSRNKYWEMIRTQYPNDYNELIYNCYSFETYFNSRTKK